MTLETKLNNEPLLNYLRESITVQRTIPSPESIKKEPLYMFPGKALFEVKDLGVHLLLYGNKYAGVAEKLYISKNSQFGWYLVNPCFTRMENGQLLAHLDFFRVGSRESYEFARDYAVQFDELEKAAMFRDLAKRAPENKACELFNAPIPKKAWLVPALAAGFIAALTGMVGVVHERNADRRAREEYVVRTTRWNAWNNLLQQSLNLHDFPAGVKAEAAYLEKPYNPAIKQLPANYSFVIQFNGENPETLSILLEEKTGIWLNRLLDNEAIVKKYGLESVITHLQNRVKQQQSQ